jgi:hypothetical protein
VPLVDLIRDILQEEIEEVEVRNLKEGGREEKEQLHQQRNQEPKEFQNTAEGRPPEHSTPVLRTPIKSPHEEQRTLTTSFVQSATPGKQHTAVGQHQTMKGKSFITVIMSPPKEADYEVLFSAFLAASLPVCVSASLIVYRHACLTTGLSFCLPVGELMMEVLV